MRRISIFLRITLVLFTALILLTAMGSNSCLWLNNDSGGAGLSGSSGALLAASPYPGNGAVNVSVSVQLNWASVSGMTGYDVYFGTTNPPDYLATVEHKIYRTIYNPGKLEYGITHYWRIDSRNGLDTLTGNVWRFTTKAAPTQVVNPSPADSAVDVPVNTLLSWDAFANAASYDVYFSTGAEPVFSANTDNPNFNPGFLAYELTYYWKVNPRNGSGTVLSRGVIWTFTTKSSLDVAAESDPADGAIDMPINTQLSWASSVGAVFYDVYFGEQDPPVFVMTVLRTLFRTKYNPGALSYDKTYYWQADARNSAGDVITGTVWSFATLPPFPVQIVTAIPADGAVDQNINAILTWSSSLGADFYDVYFGTTLQYRSNTLLTSYNPGKLAYETTYYWKINPRNGTGVTEGVLWDFTTSALAAPAQATGPYPLNNGINTLASTTLSWLSAKDADLYDVYFGIIDPPNFVATVNKSIYRTIYLPGALNFNSGYYWRIDVRNSGGVTTGAVWQFVTQPMAPAQVTTPNPFNMQPDILPSQVLSWGAAPRANSYNVYFGTTTTGWTPITNTNLTSYAPSSLEYSQTYYWRVDSKNISAVIEGQVWSFGTLIPPAKVVTTAPANNATGIFSSQKLTWAVADKAASYNVYFGTDNPPPFLNNITATNYAPTISYGTTYFWRVDSVNQAGTIAGDVLTFTTEFPPEAVTGPMFPEDNATFVDINLIISWTAAANAQSYDIYLGLTTTGWSPVVNTSQTSFFLPTLNDGTLYYWRIDSRNQAGTAMGAVRSFSTVYFPEFPNTPYPANLADAVPLTATLSWVSEYSTSFEVYFGTNTLALTMYEQTESTFDPGALLSNTQYFWRIKALNSAGWTFGELWTFRTELPDQLSFVQQPVETAAGEIISPTLKVLVKDRFDKTVSGIAITVTTTDGTMINGTLTRISDINGIVDFNDLRINTVGTYEFKAYLSVAEIISDEFNIVHNTPSQLVWNTLPDIVQTAGITWTTFVIELRDNYDNLCLNENSITVTLVTTGTSEFANGMIITASSGLAVFDSVLYNKSELMRVKGIADNLTETELRGLITVNPGPPEQLVFIVHPPEIMVAGGVISPSLVVEVQDNFGNTVPAYTGSITISGNSTFLGGELTIDAVSSVVIFADIAVGTVAGAGCSINAIGDGLNDALSNEFEILADVPVKLAFLTQPTATVRAGEEFDPTLMVGAQDTYGNLSLPYSGNITISATNTTLLGTLSVNAVSGIATFNNVIGGELLGSGCTVNANALGLALAVSDNFDIIPGLPDSLQFTQQPSNSDAGVVISPPITVWVRDIFGNNIDAEPVSVSVTDGTVLYGTLIRQSDINGIITFDDLIINKAGTGYTLRVSTVNGRTAVSSAFAIAAQAPTRLVFMVQPTATIAVGTSFSPALEIAVQDDYGNTIPVTTTITVSGIGTTLSGTLAEDTVAGVAVFNNVTVNTVPATVKSLSATASGLLGAASTLFDIVSGPVDTIAFLQQSGNTTADFIISPAMTVKLLDSYGNNIPNTPIAVTTGDGTMLYGTLSQTSDINGEATFADFRIRLAGSFALSVSAGTITVQADAIDILPDVEYKLDWGTKPNRVQKETAVWSPVYTVEVQDQWGNTVNDNSGRVISVLTATGSAGASFTGNSFVVVNGVVAFTSTTYSLTETIQIRAVSAPILIEAPALILTVVIARFSDSGGGIWNDYRPIQITNAGDPATDVQIMVEPFRDTGARTGGNNLNETGLRAKWLLDEGAGMTTADSSGNNNTGSLINSPAWVSEGRFGRALQFNGTNNYVQVPNLDINVLTFSAWIKRDRIDAGNTDRLFMAANNNGWGVGFNTNNTLFFAKTGVSQVNSTGTITDTAKWHFVAVTFDGINTRFYIDGRLDSSFTFVYNFNSSGGNYTIASRGPGEYFQGMIDEVQVHNRVMTGEEISTRYGSGLAASWHFSEPVTDTGTATADMSGNYNTGTLINNPVRVAGTRTGGNALQFDGAESYLDAGTVSSFSFIQNTGLFTIEAWIKYNNYAIVPQYIMGNTAGSTENGFYLGTEETGKLAIGIVGGGGIVITSSTSAQVITDNNWHHIAVTGDAVSVSFYVDGIEYPGAGTMGAFATGDSTNTLNIGKITGYPSGYFNGLLDEVRIYSRPLSDAEVEERYNFRVNPDFSDIRFYDPVGSASGETSPSGVAAEYNYWQETDTRFWLRIPTLPSGSSRIRMYYGNISATATTSGENTFVFFDYGWRGNMRSSASMGEPPKRCSRI